ncbi:alpha/beta hydrolase [Actinokineospora sp. NPDC004072]
MGRQMTPGVVEVFNAWYVTYVHPELPDTGVDWAATRTHSHVGAPALPGRRPVLLYSPGGGDPRGLGTGLAEDLASRGFVVVAVDHPGGAIAVEFPDGEVRPIELAAHPGTPAGFRTTVESRLADLGFVLDSLRVLARGGNPDVDGKPLPRHLARSLDLRRVGVYGHSIGGTVAAQALYEDPGIDAAVNLEGYLDYVPEPPSQYGDLLPVAAKGTPKPLLLFSTDGYWNDRYAHSWSAMLATGPRTTHRQLTNATHWVFTDFATQAPQLQAAGLMTPSERAQLIGPITPTDSRPAIHNPVAAFFTRHLH